MAYANMRGNMPCWTSYSLRYSICRDTKQYIGRYIDIGNINIGFRIGAISILKIWLIFIPGYHRTPIHWMAFVLLSNAIQNRSLLWHYRESIFIFRSLRASVSGWHSLNINLPFTIESDKSSRRRSSISSGFNFSVFAWNIFSILKYRICVYLDQWKNQRGDYREVHAMGHFSCERDFSLFENHGNRTLNHTYRTKSVL